jgi:AAA domain
VVKSTGKTGGSASAPTDAGTESSTRRLASAERPAAGQVSPNGDQPLGPDSAGRTPGDPDYNPFENPDSPLATDEAKRRETEKRKTRWKYNKYALDVLDGRQEQWARNITIALEYENAKRGPIKMMPGLIFPGDKMVEAGATDAEIAALPKLTPEGIEALQLRAAAIRRDCQKQADTLARTLAAERDGSAQPPEPLSLTELLTQTDTDPTYRIGELLPTGGRVLLAAQYKSGKTTLVGNTVRVLVDGGAFLGRFRTTPVRRVVLIDTELDTRTLRRWLRDQGIANTDAVTVIPLRGAVSTFNILDAAIRAEWAHRIGETDVLILDCLRPVLDALGLSEATEAGRVLTAFDELMAEVHAAEGMVVTHMGHQNERARGDSRLRDWNDAEWTLVRGGDEADDDASRPRFLSALGRDVSLPEGQLTFDAATRHLCYQGGNRIDQPVRDATPALLGLVRNEPGLSKAEVERRLGADHDIPQNTARAAIKAAIRATPPLLIVTPGERGSHRLSVPPGSPFDIPYHDGGGDPQPATQPAPPVLKVVTDDDPQPDPQPARAPIPKVR